jgi:hypothetical protein
MLPLTEGLIQMRFGGGGEPTRFVCGYLAYDQQIFRPLLDALPQMLRIPLGDLSVSGWSGSSPRVAGPVAVGSGFARSWLTT